MRYARRYSRTPAYTLPSGRRATSREYRERMELLAARELAPPLGTWLLAEVGRLREERDFLAFRLKKLEDALREIETRSNNFLADIAATALKETP